ncbi:hypothetical protein ACQ86N_28365 [Puia sp. P3]|uniref:hypothetical protein n=1 Tax=Puia sp. P3 TaxID=3423952 RepID=UPI003D67993E
MRALVMDFPTDHNTWNKGDEFLSGPSLLITPVTSMSQRSTTVYLPAGAAWYDLWSGTKHPGGSNTDITTPSIKYRSL